MRNNSVEKQIQQVLLYVQGELVNIQKENVLEDLEAGTLEYVTIEEFLTNLKKEFSGEDDKTMKVAELKKVE